MFTRDRNSSGIRCALAAVVFIAGCTRSSEAQSNAIDAAIEGYVRDGTGAAMSNAHVMVRNTATNVRTEADTNSEGYFRFPLLQVGAYDLTAEANGFKSVTKPGILLAAGQKVHLDLEMPVGTRTDSVEVTADATVALADTGSSAVGGVVSTKEVEDLPIVSRNIYNYQLLAPGVQGLSSPTFGTTQFAFGGNERSSWNLDGLDNTQRAGSRQIRMVITTPEAVEEVQVLSNGYSAEFGRAAGGQVNVILKSGTNQFHGSELFLFRPQSWQARPSLAATNPSESWYDEAVTLGGPIKKDKIFFFTQFEHNPYTRPNALTILPTNAAALNLPADQQGTAPFGETYDTYVGKINFQLNDRNTGYVRYARFTNHQPNSASGLTTPNRGVNFDDHMNGGGVQLATAFTPALLNEFRYGAIERTQANAPVGSATPYDVAVNITGVANIGYNPLAATSTTELSNEIIDNLTWTHGRHTWKAGVDFQHTNFDIFKSENLAYTFGGLSAVAGARGAVSALNQYLYTVQGLSDPATGKPYTYTNFAEDGGNPKLNISFNFMNWFVQDEIRLNSRFTVNAGLRYEAILFPTFDPNAPYPLSRQINDDLKDFAPRVSFNWLATKDAKTVVRGAFGTFYDVPSLAIFYTAGQVNGDRFLSYQIAGTDPNAPLFPAVPTLSSAAYIVKPNINAFAPGYKNTYQMQTNLQVQREIVRNLIVTAGYNYDAQRHGIYSQNINLGAPVSYLADGRPVFGGAALRPNQSFNQINLIQSGANTNYNALFVNIQKRMSAGLMLQLSYTWSHALSDNLGEGGSISDPTNLRRDWGNADNDLRHYLVADWLYEPHFKSPSVKWINGFELSSMFFYNSGYPVNAVAGVDLNNDGILNDRPLFRGRNDVTGPGLVQVDARVQRTFIVRERYRAVGLLEAENALNHTNASCSTAGGCSGAVINTAGAADFGRMISARTARNVQFGFKVLF
ncbi:MAG TPA: carboxypeptidase regulatory-like domain-containing protein [Bryobacteraceae bacterium]|nr:carboxypeptidase regulatory-like domain-containing protein [Bryobacteraceae bacterium]